MSLPMLVNGADCGPINPLRGLSKQFDRDRGIQQDHFGTGRAGPSREAFRSQYSAAAGSSQEAAQFFSPVHSPLALATGPPAFDLSALHASLPASQSHSPAALTPQRQTPLSPASWAADFLQHPVKHSPDLQLPASALAQSQSASAQSESNVQLHSTYSPNGMATNLRSWGPLAMSYGMNSFASMSAPPFAMPIQKAGQDVNASQWDQVFLSQEPAGQQVVTPEAAPAVEQKSPEQSRQDADELARTAGRLMETLRHEENPKFKNSEFMGLMRQLRDGDVVVDGNTMVPKEEAAPRASEAPDVKGKGRATDLRMPLGDNALMTGPTPWSSQTQPVRTDRVQIDSASTSEGYQESPIDAYLREENETYIEFQRQASRNVSQPPLDMAYAQDADWGRLQRDWDLFEATATGVRPLTHYQFQPHNPYLLGEASRTRHHFMHADMRSTLFENVLETEAAAQRDPTNAQRWFELGVKQQENEREQKAVQALRRALELEPSHLPSWLALAISYTNESNRRGAYYAIREWVDRNELYRPVVEQFRALNPEAEDMVQSDRLANLVQCLIEAARSDTSGAIDADLQIALAVLLNTSEDYSKAQDCFTTALAVRPDDWLLYNRVGATLANNGNPEEALQYYYRALELNPTYIRAKFNLGISCINLRRYEEAAHHILDALVLQDGDSIYERGGSGDKRGVTSHTLWESLKTCCLHLQRIDLATLCDREDLEAFRLNFVLS
ncbi:hypothetical protein POSPLADRAFT_1053107 [Postia placenta MAD-698-R-SB12]|uniref:Uncharacterized protein n=1 Tax=Postia placenta MAD-698-R-SB12 TaxID=670580 RepID=A0A1X6NDF4_9APHY|nr:hypothetical protein POSPLADRAFT_1053107 [Postia placenta MAD-698-R-SB12]OSX66466.1 hypothetical protein POSPLADRAFT_1053107 [Postia placenta MAD-698-R-SB12]